jgi:hypothetical protein
MKGTLGLLEYQINRHPLNPWHGGNGFPCVLTIEHKHRVNKVGRGQCVLTHQGPRKRIPTIPTQASCGKSDWKYVAHLESFVVVVTGLA